MRPRNRPSTRATTRSPSPSPPPPTAVSPITGYTANCTSSNGGTAGTNTGASSPITVGSLDNGKTYTCTVTATNANGNGPASPASNPAVPSTTPAAPTQPGASAGNAQITVTFSAPADGGSPITGYTANCTSTNGGTAGNNTGSGSPITVTGLTNGKTYTCTVTAANANGNGSASPVSASAIPKTVPSAPAKPGVAATDSQISVTFTGPADGGSPITGYTANCTSSNGGTAGNNTGASSPITVGSLDNGKTYTCTVTATNAQRKRTRLTRIQPGRPEHDAGRARATRRGRGQLADRRDLRRPVRRWQPDHRLHRQLHLHQRRHRRKQHRIGLTRSPSPGSPTPRPTPAP